MRSLHLASAATLSTGAARAHREWALEAPFTGAVDPWGLRALTRVLAREGQRPCAGPPGLALIRVPPALLGQAIAVLHYTAGQLSIYCPETHLSGRAAETIPVLVEHAGVLAPRGSGAARRAVIITPVHHDILPQPLHPAMAMITSKRAEICVCASLISPGLAAAVSDLFAEHAALLARCTARAAPRPAAPQARGDERGASHHASRRQAGGRPARPLDARHGTRGRPCDRDDR